MDRREMITGRKARIESELIPYDVRCLSFYYYLDETVGAQLNIYQHNPRLNTTQMIWTVDQSHGPMWVLQRITLQPNMTGDFTSRFTIIYEAVVGTRTGGKNSFERSRTFKAIFSFQI